MRARMCVCVTDVAHTAYLTRTNVIYTAYLTRTIVIHTAYLTCINGHTCILFNTYRCYTNRLLNTQSLLYMYKWAYIQLIQHVSDFRRTAYLT
jgi:hypothetical protein